MKARDIMLRSFVEKVAKEIKKKPKQSKLRKYGPYAAAALALPVLAYAGARLAPGAYSAAKGLRRMASKASREASDAAVRNVFPKRKIYS